MSTRHLLTTAGLAAAGVLLLAGPAAAHIEPSVESGAAGSYLTFSLQVPHGCGEGGTTKLEVQIPESISSVTPGVVPGWTIDRTIVPLNPPVDDGEGGQITERTSVITWTGGPLAHDQLLLFPLSVKLPDKGSSVSFPTIQTCDNGQHTDWIEKTKAGKEEPEHPAPTIELTAATGDEHAPDTMTETASEDDDSDSSSALGITGIALGAVGIVLGGSALRRAPIGRLTCAPPPIARITRPLARALLGGLVLAVLSAAPAAADPAGPSDFRSEVTGIAPTVKGVHAEIRGGDTFLEVTVDHGHDVIVEGYQQEPYLHFLPDGTVQRNRRSSATYLNNSRKGKGVVPAEAQDPAAAPVWEDIGHGGSYAWHDHRVHWMSEVRPSVSRGQKVPGAYDPWKVPMRVDGTAVDIEGSLTYESAMSPLPWIIVAVLAAAALAWFGRRRAVLAAAAALTAASAVAVVVGRADFSSTPGGGNPLLWMLPVVAVLAAGAALVPRLKAIIVIGPLASVACLSAWVFLRFQVLTKPVLPTSLPFWLDRTTTAVGLGVSLAGAYLAVTSGQLQLAPLADDDVGT